MTDPDGDTDRGSASRDPASRDGSALLAATPDADAVFAQIRTVAVLVGVLALFVLLITVELLVRL